MAEAETKIEQSLLGAMILERSAIVAAMEYISPTYFREERHQDICTAIQYLYDKGDPVDIVGLCAELQRRGKLKIVGDRVYLLELTETIGTSANADYHARKVRDSYLSRKLLELCEQTKAQAQGTELNELLEKHEAGLFGISQKYQSGEITPLSEALAQNLSNLHGDVQLGLQTGFYEWDQMTAGLYPAEVIIIAARPSMGKTALCLAVARNWLKKNIPVGFISLESTKLDLSSRLISMETEVSALDLRRGKLSEGKLTLIGSTVDSMRDWPLFIDDSCGSRVGAVCGSIRRLVSKYKCQVVILDYLQLMSTGHQGNRNEELTAISRAIRNTAKETNVPLVIVSQLKRIEERDTKKPRLADLRESGAIEQDADVVLLIYRPEFYRMEKFPGKDGSPTKNMAEIDIAKNRNGPTGSFKLVFLKEYARFENLETNAGV